MPFHLVTFLTFYLILSFITYSCLILLDFLCCFYELGKTATSPTPEGIVFLDSHLLCLLYGLVTLAGWLELWLMWTGGPRVLHAQAALVGWLELKWTCLRWSWGSSHRES